MEFEEEYIFEVKGDNQLSLIPSNIAYLTIINENNYQLDIENLSKNLVSLTFKGKFNSPIFDEGKNYLIPFLPSNLKKLVFNDQFNKSIGGYVTNQDGKTVQILKALPSNLEILVFGEKFNQPVNAINFKDGSVFSLLPDNLKFLTLGKKFASRAEDYINKNTKLSTYDIFVLPPSLTYLNLGDNFNLPLVHKLVNGQIVGFLPSSLETLILGNYFTKKLDGLPPNLKSLTLGDNYKEALFDEKDDDVLSLLPSSLTSLTFGDKFNQPLYTVYNNRIIRALPDSLTSLTFDDKFNQPLYVVDNNNQLWLLLGRNLKSLTFGQQFNQVIGIVRGENIKINPLLPDSLTRLTFGDGFNQPVFFTNDNIRGSYIPSLLEELSFGINFNQPLEDKISSALPSSLIRLKLDGNFNQPLDSLPNNLTYLTFGSGRKDFAGDKLSYPSFNQPLDSLPSSLQYLKFDSSSDFNQSLDHLPNSLIYLRLGNDFDRPLDYLPNLETLIFTKNSRFTHVIDHFPSTLEVLKMGYYFNRRIDYLPSSLITLIFGGKFNQPLHLLRNGIPIKLIPSSVIDLEFGEEFNQLVEYENNLGRKVSLLPPKLERLKFGNNFGNRNITFDGKPVNQSLTIFPSTLKILDLGKGFEQSLYYKRKGSKEGSEEKISILPPSLKELSLNSTEDPDFSIHHHLKALRFKNIINSLILPPNLEILMLNDIRNKITQWPSSMKFLIGIYEFQKPEGIKFVYNTGSNIYLENIKEYDIVYHDNNFNEIYPLSFTK